MNIKNTLILATIGFFFLLLISCDSKEKADLSDFEIHPDFEIELVAKEPVVFDPVDLEFDEKGRAFVIEMPAYPFPEIESRVVLLEDKDGDRVFDKRTVFAEKLGMGTSILPYQGGLLVTAPPNLLYVKDTDGDGSADQREVVLSGFAVGNPQHNYSGLTYGLDNWIYAADGGNSGEVYWPGDEQNIIPVRGNDYRFKLEEKQFELIGKSSGGFELTMDDWGNIYENHNLRHISHLVLPGRYIDNLPVSPPHTLENISQHDENGMARIYPIGEQVTRVNHPEQSGYFSGACGITFYGGDAFPEGFNDNVFVADVVLNLIHRDIIAKDGASMAARRGRDRIEFLASRDRAFRPVNMTVGPDGALYLLDMHREVIEHPEWIPDEIEKDLDLDAGKDKGRIYRIVPKGGLDWEDPRFDSNNLKGVVSQLEHSNKWWRDAAQRLLVEWQNEDAVPLLSELYEKTEIPQARLHALWTLHGLGALENNLLENALQDDHPAVREHAVIIAEDRLREDTDLIQRIIAMAGDRDQHVRAQVALTLGTISSDIGVNDEIQKALYEIAQQDVSDTYSRMAVVSGTKHAPLPMMEKILSDKSMAQKAGGQDLLESLAKLMGTNQNTDDIAAVLQIISASDFSERHLVIPILDGFSQGWERSASGVSSRTPLVMTASLRRLEANKETPIIRSSWKLRKAMNVEPPQDQSALLSRAADIASDPSETLERRMEHLELLEFADYSLRKPILFDLLDTREPKALQLAAVEQLSKVKNEDVAVNILKIWKKLGPEARVAAGDILLYKSDNHELLLSALEGGEIKLGEMNLHLERRRVLLHSEDKSIRKRAEALFSDAGVVTRKEAIDKMRPALTMRGNPAEGEAVYKEQCAQCHRVGEIGVEVGPDLTEISRKSKESIMHDILDPNAAMDTKFISHTIKTKDGEIINGIVASETEDAVTLRAIQGKETTVSRDDIKELTATSLSLMPEGFEQILSQQEMADLLAYLQEYR